MENKREIRKMAARRSQKRGSEGTACVFFARFVFKYFFVTILDEMKLFLYYKNIIYGSMNGERVISCTTKCIGFTSTFLYLFS